MNKFTPLLVLLLAMTIATPDEVIAANELQSQDILVAQNDDEAPKKRRKRRRRKKAPRQMMDSENSDMAYGDDESSSSGSSKFMVSGPVMLVDGDALFGAYLDGWFPMSENLYVGAEVGGFYRSVSAGAVSVSVLVFPVTASLTYQISNSPGFAPFIGGNAGLAIINASASAGSISGSASTTEFTGYIHGGGFINDSFMVSLRLGVLANVVMIGPSIGIKF